MKSRLQLFSLVTALCLLTAAAAIAAAPPPTGPSRAEGRQMATPLAEMMFYEAAEQAVQDGYATIVPDEPESKTGENEADKTEPAEQPTAPTAVEQQN